MSNTLVYLNQGGKELTIASGGQLNIKSGGKLLVDGIQGAAITVGLTAITHTAPTVSDFAIQDLVSTAAFGFVTKDEGNTVLRVIANLQTRVSELEARLEAAGIVIVN